MVQSYDRGCQKDNLVSSENDYYGQGRLNSIMGKCPSGPRIKTALTMYPKEYCRRMLGSTVKCSKSKLLRASKVVGCNRLKSTFPKRKSQLSIICLPIN